MAPRVCPTPAVPEGRTCAWMAIVSQGDCGPGGSAGIPRSDPSVGVTRMAVGEDRAIGRFDFIFMIHASGSFRTTPFTFHGDVDPRVGTGDVHPPLSNCAIGVWRPRTARWKSRAANATPAAVRTDVTMRDARCDAVTVSASEHLGSITTVGGGMRGGVVGTPDRGSGQRGRRRSSALASGYTATAPAKKSCPSRHTVPIDVVLAGPASCARRLRFTCGS